MSIGRLSPMLSDQSVTDVPACSDPRALDEPIEAITVAGIRIDPFIVAGDDRRHMLRVWAFAHLRQVVSSGGAVTLRERDSRDERADGNACSQCLVQCMQGGAINVKAMSSYQSDISKT